MRYGDAYHAVVDEVMRLERIAEDVALELLDCAVTIIAGAVPVVGPYIVGINNLWGFINPPDSVPQLARLAIELRDTVTLAIRAVWDFNARCELGALVPVNGALPTVPEPSVLYG